jgi:uncharacterized repeat protein (TIGR04138 family)
MAMQKIGFNEALAQITAKDPRYDTEGYLFLRNGLDYTLRQSKKHKDDPARHVSGQELLEGLRAYALKEFGPMARTVLDYWGIRKGEDFGAMVFNLVEAGVFGKTDTDSIEDFKGGYTFEEAFDAPYRVTPRASAPKKQQTPKSPLQNAQ